MRKTVFFISMLVVLTFVGGLVYGSGIDNKTNWSAGYIRTLNRNATYDNPDAVVYNPAGVIKLGSGFHLGAHNQFLLLDYSHESAAEKYSANNPTLFLPSAFLTYNRDRWAAFGAFYISGGGGKLEYDDGIADLNEPPLGLDPANPSLTIKSIYYTGALGGVFAINEMFALAASGKIVYGFQDIDSVTEFPVPALGNTTEMIHVKETALGFGGVFGLNIALPVMETNIGIRYETKVKLDWEVKESGDGALDPQYGNIGDTSRQDLPAMLALGVSIKPLPILRTEASFTYYFNKSANWEGLEDNVENGWEAGAVAELSIIPGLVGSVGVLYADPGADQDSYIYLSPALKSFSVAGGVSVRMIPNLVIDFGVLKPFYTEDDGFSQPPVSAPVTVDKSLWIIAAGVSYTIGM